MNLKSESPRNESWAGSTIQDIYGTLGPWQYYISPVSASKYHTVLYELPAIPGQPPKPHRSKQNDWDSDHVRMPYSPKNLFPIKNVRRSILWEYVSNIYFRKMTKMS